MRHETIVWAYSDMKAARRLWPRVKDIVEERVESGELDLSLAEQRRLIAAVVNDLLEREKQRNRRRQVLKTFDRFIHRFRKSETDLREKQSA